MRAPILSVIALAVAVVSALPADVRLAERQAFNPRALLACGALKLEYGGQVFYPGQKNYTEENEREFSTITNSQLLLTNDSAQTFGRPQITLLQLVSLPRKDHSKSQLQSLQSPA